MPRSASLGRSDINTTNYNVLTSLHVNQNDLGKPQLARMRAHGKRTGRWDDLCPRLELVLCVDANTKVFPDSLTRMLSCTVCDEIVGLHSETKIANKVDTFVTIMQGGLFSFIAPCMAASPLKAPNGDSGFWVLIIANPDIVQHHSENVVDTLHKKDLLLGEDRTIHNVAELDLVRDLCRTFCFSLQFVVGMELAGTLFLPATISLTLYLIIESIVPHHANATISLILLSFVLALPLDDFSDNEDEFDSKHIVMKRCAEFERESRWKSGTPNPDSDEYYNRKRQSNSDRVHAPSAGADSWTIQSASASTRQLGRQQHRRVLVPKARQQHVSLAPHTPRRLPQHLHHHHHDAMSSSSSLGIGVRSSEEGGYAYDTNTNAHHLLPSPQSAVLESWSDVYNGPYGYEGSSPQTMSPQSMSPPPRPSREN
ncbi:chitin synthase-domain-containing protein [Mycena epipterygia]|nr:chitin synthase-domain-containing protein [Mycena epipterygia]